MSVRAEKLAATLEEVNDEIVAIIVGCTDEQLRQSSVGEGWEVAVVGHHVAVVHTAFAPLAERFAEGGTHSPAVSWDEIHRMNAEHAREYAGVDRQVVLDKLRTNGAELAAKIRTIGEDQMDRVAGVYGDNELTVEQVTEYVFVGHPMEHLTSIRATVETNVGAAR